MEAYVMDAFSVAVFGGNQAGVVLPDRELTDSEMQQIAAEFKHSETAFVHVEQDGSVTLRYFTPAGEVDLCGHATIASIALLRQKAPWVKIVVGGAVLTQEYADAIGADFYAKDAMAGVRYSLQVVE